LKREAYGAAPERYLRGKANSVSIPDCYPKWAVHGLWTNGLKIDEPRDSGKAVPAAYTVGRGVYQPLTDTECLLWTQGAVDGVNIERPRQPVFKEAPLKPMADPIMLRRFSGEGGWHATRS
jgi:hypothetical protein